MTESLDTRQSLAEIERAMFKNFPFPSNSITTHVTTSDGVVTTQVSWIASAGGTELDECNVRVGVDESILADDQRGRV